MNDGNLRGKGEMMQEKLSKILVMTISVKEMGDINIYSFIFKLYRLRLK